MERILLAVEGMSGDECIAAVRDALEELPGVEIEEIELGAVTVLYDPLQSSSSDLIEAIEGSGYEGYKA